MKGTVASSAASCKTALADGMGMCACNDVNQVSNVIVKMYCYGLGFGLLLQSGWFARLLAIFFNPFGQSSLTSLQCFVQCFVFRFALPNQTAFIEHANQRVALFITADFKPAK